MKTDIQIFLVDDDADDQEIFTLALQQLNPSIKCVFADDGIYALEKLKSNNNFLPSVIFMDINMPRMNGVECLVEIKKLPGLSYIPLYMYSTSAELFIVEECLRYGAAGFLKKEINIEDLQKHLRQIIAQF
ncbi:MAG: response regulator [Parafilimonas sp.]|nr:response regulator [Parafilimonas sp.]